MLNDDLQNREYDNVALQAQRDVYMDQLQKYQDIITHLRIRYVPHAKDQGKEDIVMIIEKIPPLRKISFMSILTTFQEYNDGSLAQIYDGLRHNIPIIGL